MGRSRECELLIVGRPADGLLRHGSASASLPPAADRLAQWRLSPAQTVAAGQALRYLEALAVPHAIACSRAPRREFLLWAVTGAGKTEMIFPLIESVLLRGGTALVATPRTDVVRELDPRIRRAFPGRTVATLYGGSEQRWERAEITLATTHQLLRFAEAFDLVVIDELDAFPFHGSPMLHYAAARAGAPSGTRVLLSATPPRALKVRAERGRLPHARIPVRYHRKPLPVPMLLAVPAVREMLKKRRMPAKLQAAIAGSVARGAQLFIFVQQIAHTEGMAALVAALCPPHAKVGHTSSKDADRAEQVRRFRAGELRVLVTTTILERGVTIPKSDVIVLDADGRLFDEASLVQMAGRAGRSADDPYGKVVFCAPTRSRSQLAAVRHIRQMNRIAERQGYLLHTDRGSRP